MNELELKFSLPPELQDSVAREIPPGQWQLTRITSRYHDTPDGELTRARIALRVRRKGDDWLQTVKGEGVDHFQRFEWERPISGPTPERAALPPPDTPQGAVVHRCLDRLVPLFETDCERRSTLVEAGHGLVIEMAQDIGEVRCETRSETRSEPIREIELECVSGSRLAFFEWSLAWAQRHQACLLMPTKSERGLRLAGRLPSVPAPVMAPPRPRTTAGGRAPLASEVLMACISHAAANIEPILSGTDPEGPRQWGLALRRLRAALRHFRLTQASRSGSALALESDSRMLSRLARQAGDSQGTALRRELAEPKTSSFILQTLLLAEQLTQAESSGGAAPSDTRPMQ